MLTAVRHRQRLTRMNSAAGLLGLAKPDTPLIGPPASTQLDLSWTDTSSGESGFKIERGNAAGGPFAQIGTNAANDVTYSDTGLTPETTYYYRVRAYHGAGNGPYSDVFSGTTGAAEFSVAYQTDILQEMYSDQYIWQDDALTTPATSDGDPVGGWQSRTGTKHFIQATGADKPTLQLNEINGLPCVSFDGDSDFLKALFSLTRPFHIFMIFKQRAWNFSERILNGATVDWSLGQRPTGPQISVYNDSAWSGENGNLAVGTWGIVEVLCSAVESRIRINNTTATVVTNGPSGDIGGMTLGSYRTPSSFTAIDVAAYLLYGAELNSTNRDAVVTALATRYGISL